MEVRAISTRCGFTLLEVFLSAVILAIILVVSLTLLSSGVQTASQSAAQGSVQVQADRVLEMLARELKDSGEESTGWEVGVTPEPPNEFYNQDVNIIQFSRCIGYDAEADMLLWGPVLMYQYVEDAPNQPGRLVRSVNGSPTTVCDRVETFSVRYESERSMVAITMSVRHDNPESPGHTVRASYTTSVKLRN